jgi:hypothetical protein
MGIMEETHGEAAILLRQVRRDQICGWGDKNDRFRTISIPESSESEIRDRVMYRMWLH